MRIIIIIHVILCVLIISHWFGSVCRWYGCSCGCGCGCGCLCCWTQMCSLVCSAQNTHTETMNAHRSLPFSLSIETIYLSVPLLPLILRCCLGFQWFWKWEFWKWKSIDKSSRASKQERWASIFRWFESILLLWHEDWRFYFRLWTMCSF